MNDISINLEGASELIQLWNQAPEIVREELYAATYGISLNLEREVKDRTPVGVGGAAGLRGSIAAQEPAVLADEVIGVVGTAALHAQPVEFGTRPHFPPLEPLQDWVRAKLDVEAEDVEGVALAIARKIAARGTLAVGMFNRAFNANRANIERAYAHAQQRIVQRLADNGA